MLCEKIICAGFGGQGVMSLGQLLAYGAMLQGKHVTWLPSYGPEMRGGTAYCCVVVSDKPIGSPMITDNATCCIVMNLPSLNKFESAVIPGGLLLVNSSLIEQKSYRDDIQPYYLPVVEEAIACGNVKIANIVMLGAYLEATGLVQPDSVIKAFLKVFGAKAGRMTSLNSDALKRGMALIHAASPVCAAA